MSCEGGDADDIPAEAYSLLHKIASQWNGIVNVQELVLKVLKGSMTNRVYECHWSWEDGHCPKKVLVRIYGNSANLLFERENEIITFERMSQLGHGPRLLGRFPNGRLEEFLDARTLSAKDLRDPDISQKIAIKLNEFHHLDIPGSSHPRLWERLRDWLEKSNKLCKPEIIQEFQLERLQKEISNLSNSISKPNERVGFCHNDLQYGNIMINEKDDEITLIVWIANESRTRHKKHQESTDDINFRIFVLERFQSIGNKIRLHSNTCRDYEYASYNPVAFDIANHFCEMMADYHTETPHLLDQKKYPDFAERQRFVECYLEVSGKGDDWEVENLMNDIDHYVLASHIHWGLWGILSANVAEIDFDYLGYARERFKLYYQHDL